FAAVGQVIRLIRLPGLQKIKRVFNWRVADIDQTTKERLEPEAQQAALERARLHAERTQLVRMVASKTKVPLSHQQLHSGYFVCRELSRTRENCPNGRVELLERRQQVEPHAVSRVRPALVRGVFNVRQTEVHAVRQS